MPDPSVNHFLDIYAAKWKLPQSRFVNQLGERTSVSKISFIWQVCFRIPSFLKRAVTGNTPMVRIIFLHIPKAGGMTLRHLIINNYREDEVFFIDSFDYEGSFEKLFRITEKNPNQLKVIGGHIGFGLHERLPGSSQYITVLRNPVERVVSQYHYIIRTPQHYLYNKIVSNKISLIDYANGDLTREISNDQTRMISGAAKMLGINDNNHYYLDLAKENLTKYFCVAGLLERWDETVTVFMHELGWSNLTSKKKNVASYDKSAVVTTDVIDVITERNLLDIQLYHYAEKLFEKKRMHEYAFGD